MNQKYSKEKRRLRGEKEIQLWLKPDAVQALEYIINLHPRSNNTEIMNLAIITLYENYKKVNVSHFDNNYQAKDILNIIQKLEYDIHECKKRIYNLEMTSCNNSSNFK